MTDPTYEQRSPKPQIPDPVAMMWSLSQVRYLIHAQCRCGGLVDLMANDWESFQRGLNSWQAGHYCSLRDQEGLEDDRDV